MQILAHRGYWNKHILPNSMEAFKNALNRGYGFESDVRDYLEELVISHNIADRQAVNAENVFRMLQDYCNQFCFAINIKADGLKDILSQTIEKYQLHNYFLFDMSVPQMMEFSEMGLRFFSRQSEVEAEPVLYEKAAGVWLDGFWGTEWITEELLKGHAGKGKEICIVSPELHKRKSYMEFWGKLKSYNVDLSKILLCTDYPDKARSFFNE